MKTRGNVISRRALAVILTLAMIITMLPASVFADEALSDYSTSGQGSESGTSLVLHQFGGRVYSSPDGGVGYDGVKTDTSVTGYARNVITKPISISEDTISVVVTFSGGSNNTIYADGKISLYNAADYPVSGESAKAVATNSSGGGITATCAWADAYYSAHKMDIKISTANLKSGNSYTLVFDKDIYRQKVEQPLGIDVTFTFTATTDSDVEVPEKPEIPYGFQGDGGNTLQLKEPSDIKVDEISTLEGVNWYKNIFKTLPEISDDGYMYFGYTMSAGINSFSEATFNTYKDKIGIYDADMQRVKDIEYVGFANRIVTIRAYVGDLSGGTYMLRFGPEVCGNNSAKRLGCYITFEFSLVTPVTGITLNQEELTLNPKRNSVLTAAVEPADATNKNVTWSSDNEAVATVSEDGFVTAVAPGTADITVTTEDGGFTAVAKVTVEASEITGLRADAEDEEIYPGETTALKAYLTPDDILVEDVTWTSSNVRLATVDENGNVTAIRPGAVAFTAVTEDGTYKDTAVVTVKPVKVTGVKVSAKTATMTVGGTKTITATVAPADATDSTVIWSSSNSKAAKVSSTGKVTAVAPGTAVITATTKDGAFKAKTTVTVNPKTSSITLTGKKKAVTVKYKKVSGVTGYQIYRSTSKNGTYKKVATRSQSKAGTYTNSKLASNKTYYYKIRTYKTVGGKNYYSSFSTVKSVKTK